MYFESGSSARPTGVMTNNRPRVSETRICLTAGRRRVAGECHPQKFMVLPVEFAASRRPGLPLLDAITEGLNDEDRKPPAMEASRNVSVRRVVMRWNLLGSSRASTENRTGNAADRSEKYGCHDSRHDWTSRRHKHLATGPQPNGWILARRSPTREARGHLPTRKQATFHGGELPHERQCQSHRRLN